MIRFDRLLVIPVGFELEMFIHFSIDTYTPSLDPTLFAPPTDTLNVSHKQC